MIPVRPASTLASTTKALLATALGALAVPLELFPLFLMKSPGIEVNVVCGVVIVGVEFKVVVITVILLVVVM